MYTAATGQSRICIYSWADSFIKSKKSLGAKIFSVFVWIYEFLMYLCGVLVMYNTINVNL